MMVRNFFQYVIIVVFSLFFLALAVALWDFWQTGTPFKGEQLASFAGHGFALLFNVIFNYQVYASIGTYSFVALFSAWISQPGNRKKIGRMIR